MPVGLTTLLRIGEEYRTASAARAEPTAGTGRDAGQQARRRFLGLVALAVAGATVLRLPLHGRPLSADEAGYLMVASQLGPGRSLYGDYWVDRPPLLLGFFAVADMLGGADALRVLGLLLVAAAVVAAAALGWLAAGEASRSRTGVVCAATAALFLSTPLFGTTEVNGELIAAPLVLSGVALLLGAVQAGRSDPRRGLLAAAGAAGAAAVLVKQNQWDVFVLLAALLLVGRRSRDPRRLRPGDLLPVLAAAALTVATAVAGAARLGTSPVGLWDAVVVFRLQAAAVIGSSASDATGSRLVDLVVAFGLSGAPLVLLLLLRAARHAPATGVVDLRLPVLAVLGWECLAVLGGASYWPPYLVCFVTGLVLATAVVQTRADAACVGRGVAVALGCVALAGVVSLGWALTHPPARAQDGVVDWLRSHAAPGDDAVVAYGHPDVLRGAGLHSPYPELWSLPVRVRDPHLHGLGRLLRGPRAPDWVVLTGPSLATWGVDARAGGRALQEHYVQEAVVGRYTVYRHEPDGDRP